MARHAGPHGSMLPLRGSGTMTNLTTYSVTGLSEMSQSLPLKIEM